MSSPTRICPGCNNSYEGRPDAKVCSSRCRKRVFRARQAIKQEVDKLAELRQNAIADIENSLMPRQLATVAAEAPSDFDSDTRFESSTPDSYESSSADSGFIPTATQPAGQVISPNPPVAEPEIKPPANKPSAAQWQQLQNSWKAPTPPSPQILSLENTPSTTPGTLPPTVNPFTSPLPELASSPGPAAPSPTPASLPPTPIPPSPPSISQLSQQLNPLSPSTQPLAQSSTSSAQSLAPPLQPSPPIYPLAPPPQPLANLPKAPRVGPRARLNNLFSSLRLRPAVAIFSMLGLVLLVGGVLAVSKLTSHPSSTPTSVASTTNGNLIQADAQGVLGLNFDTVLAKGKTFTAGQIIAGPDSSILQVTGDVQSSGSLLASKGQSSLNNTGLKINNVIVCTVAGCKAGSTITLASTLSGQVSLINLPTEVTTQGNTFNIASQLVQLTSAGLLPVLSGINLTNLNASNIASGTLGDARLSTNIALLNGSQTFSGSPLFQNTANSTTAFRIQNATGTNLVLVDTVAGTVTVVGLQGSGANLTALNASNISSGTLADGRLSTNVSLLGQSIESADITDGTIVNADISATAAIAYSKLNLASSIVTGDITDLTIVNADISATAGIVDTKLATISTAGKVSDSALSANVALLNGTGPQTFTGNNSFTGTFLAQNAADSATAFQVQNAASNPYLLVNTTGASISVGNTSIASTIQIGNTTGGVAQTIAIGNNATALSTSAVTIGNLLGTSATTIQGGTGNINLQAAGTATIGRIQIGAGGVGSTTPDFLALDVKSDTGDPAGGAEGYMYYNTFDNKFRCYQNAAWADCVSSGGVSAVGTIDSQAKSADGAVIAGASIYMQTADATNPGLVSTGIQTLAGAKTFSGAALFKNAADSATAFQIQNLASNPYLLVNTSGASISVGDTSIASTIQIGNTTGAVAQTIAVGNNATALSTTNLTIGNLLGTSATTIQGGTGASAIGLQAGTSGTISLGTTNVNTVTIGSTANTGTLTFGQATTGETINIGNGNVATGNTNTINIGATATITGKEVITIGSTVAASSLTLRAGSGNVSINATAGTVTLQTTTSGAINITPASVDGTNIVLGTSDTVGTQLVLDTKTTAGDPTCTIGGIYYNSSTNRFRSCEGSPTGWTDLGLPVGSVIQFSAATAPDGYLITDGSAISRTTYAKLFAVIGTTYGAGDAATTFNLPDFRGRVATGYAASGGHTDVATLGNNDGVALASRRPKHNHTFTQPTISSPAITVVQPTISSPGINITDPGHFHGYSWTISGGSGAAIPVVSGSATTVQQTGNTGSKTTGISAALASAPTASGGTATLASAPVATLGAAGVGGTACTDSDCYEVVNFIIKY